jgi:hypothetical protein
MIPNSIVGKGHRLSILLKKSIDLQCILKGKESM